MPDYPKQELLLLASMEYFQAICGPLGYVRFMLTYWVKNSRFHSWQAWIQFSD